LTLGRCRIDQNGTVSLCVEFIDIERSRRHENSHYVAQFGRSGGEASRFIGIYLLGFFGMCAISAQIARAIEYHFGLDLLVRTPQQLAERLALGDFFLQEVVEKGQVLYAHSDAGMD